MRQQVGYGRYDTLAELEALNELYAHLRLYVNFFQPQMKLVSKTRRGSAVTKRYDRAMTPYRRLLGSPHIDEEIKISLTRTYLELNPVELKRRLTACQDRLLEVARAKPTRKEVKHPPNSHVGAKFSWQEISRTSSVRQPGAASRTS